MERRLFTLAIFLFFVELTLYLADMGWIVVPGFTKTSIKQEQPVIGEVVAARQFVRRRAFDSNIWEDSGAAELLYENDSILTLNGSSAKLKLIGEINLDLHENTLVVLEPVSENKDQPFRLRFSRGDVRTQVGTKGLQVQSGDWLLDAKPGTDLVVRAIDAHQVEINVNSGNVNVVHQVSGQSAQVSSEQKLTLNPEEIDDLVTTSEAMAWSDRRPLRLYSHKFPVDVPVSWSGAASELRVSTPGQSDVRIPISAGTQKTSVPLDVGSYHLVLRDNDKVSQPLPVEVLLAPKIIYLTPLPRDRVMAQNKMLFSWLTDMPIAKFRLEISKDAAGKEIVHAASTETNKVSTTLPPDGPLYWQVLGYDEDGFIIPPSHSYPIYSVPDPLAPPQLRAPSAEDDDSAQYRPPTLRIHPLVALWKLFMAVAEGQPSKKQPVIFNWDPLPGADYYMIEISYSEDFKNPLIVARTSSNFYAWSDFTKGIYYYRVAGGANSGRMGLFTTPTKVDLTHWPPPKAPPVASSAAQPRPAEKLDPSAPPPPKIVDPEEPPIYDKHFARVWWRGTYSAQNINGADRVKAQLAGGSIQGLGFEIPKLGSLPISFSATWAHYDWKPKSKTDLPYQPNFSTDILDLEFLWQEAHTRWGYGLVLGSRPNFKRDSLETISATTSMNFGGTLRYTYPILNGEMVHSGMLLIGASQTELQLRNRWSHPFFNRFQYGFEGNFSFGLVRQTGAGWQLGAILGVMF